MNFLEYKMSKMADLDLAIKELLTAGNDPVIVAQFLEIPITWIYETSDNVDEDFNPFNTINS